jgi:hypothetical protein
MFMASCIINLRSQLIIVNFEHVTYFFLLFSLYFSTVSTALINHIIYYIDLGYFIYTVNFLTHVIVRTCHMLTTNHD